MTIKKKIINITIEFSIIILLGVLLYMHINANLVDQTSQLYTNFSDFLILILILFISKKSSISANYEIFYNSSLSFVSFLLFNQIINIFYFKKVIPKSNMPSTETSINKITFSNEKVNSLIDYIANLENKVTKIYEIKKIWQDDFYKYIELSYILEVSPTILIGDISKLDNSQQVSLENTSAEVAITWQISMVEDHMFPIHYNLHSSTIEGNVFSRINNIEDLTITFITETWHFLGHVQGQSLTLDLATIFFNEKMDIILNINKLWQKELQRDLEFAYNYDISPTILFSGTWEKAGIHTNFDPAKFKPRVNSDILEITQEENAYKLKKLSEIEAVWQDDFYKYIELSYILEVSPTILIGDISSKIENISNINKKAIEEATSNIQFALNHDIMGDIALLIVQHELECNFILNMTWLTDLYRDINFVYEHNISPTILAGDLFYKLENISSMAEKHQKFSINRKSTEVALAWDVDMAEHHLFRAKYELPSSTIENNTFSTARDIHKISIDFIRETWYFLEHVQGHELTLDLATMFFHEKMSTILATNEIWQRGLHRDFEFTCKYDIPPTILFDKIKNKTGMYSKFDYSKFKPRVNSDILEITQEENAYKLKKLSEIEAVWQDDFYKYIELSYILEVSPTILIGDISSKIENISNINKKAIEEATSNIQFALNHDVMGDVALLIIQHELECNFMISVAWLTDLYRDINFVYEHNISPTILAGDLFYKLENISSITEKHHKIKLANLRTEEIARVFLTDFHRDVIFTVKHGISQDILIGDLSLKLQKADNIIKSYLAEFNNLDKKITSILQNVTKTPEMFSALTEMEIQSDLASVYIKLFISVIVIMLILVFKEKIKSQWLKNKLVTDCELAFFFNISFFSLLGLTDVENFLHLYIYIELYSLCTYLITASSKTKYSLQSTITYFLIGTLGSIIFIFGISIIYGLTGGIEFSYISLFISPAVDFTMMRTSIMSFFLIISGLFIKFGIAPYHSWVPRVYKELSFFFFSYLLLIPKILLVYIVYNIYFNIFIGVEPGISWTLNVYGYINIFFGSVLAINQFEIRRIFIFSSIANVGYIFLGFSTYSYLGVTSAVTYLILYAILFILTAGFLNLLNIENKNKFLTYGSINILKILNIGEKFKLFFIIFLLIFAGLPPFILFYAKLSIIYALIIKGDLYSSLLILVFSSLSMYYYMNFIKILLFQKKLIQNQNWKNNFYLDQIFNLEQKLYTKDFSLYLPIFFILNLCCSAIIYNFIFAEVYTLLIYFI